MKASKLIQDLARQIAEHGDLEVVNTMYCKYTFDINGVVKSAMKHDTLDVIEIYGEEK